MRFFLIVLLCLLFDEVAAQDIRWTGQNKIMEIVPAISVVEDPGGKLCITQVADSSFSGHFRPSHQSVLHFGFTTSWYWLRFSIDDPGPQSLLLELDQAFLPSVTLYYDSAGDWKSLQSGYKIPLQQKPVSVHAQVFPIPPGKYMYYIRLQPLVHTIPVRLWKKEAFLLHDSREKMVFGIYDGILLFMIVINFFLFLFLKKLYYLNYLLLIFFYMLTSALVMEGYAIYFFPGADLMYWYQVVPVLDMPAMLLYCVSFLEIKKYSQPLYRGAISASIFFIFYLAILHFLPLMPVLLLNQALALGVFVMAMVIGIKVGKGGNRLGYYFAATYSIWFLLISLEVVYIQLGYPRHVLPVSYVSTAIFLEALMLAFLLVKRFQWDKRDDQRKQFELELRMNQLAAENEKQLLNVKLEIQEQTLQNISQEIHDNIGQILSLAKLQLFTAGPSGNEAVDMKIDGSKRLVAKAIVDLRNLSHSLNGEYVSSVGLARAVEAELDIIRKSGQYEVVFNLEGEEYRLGIQHELILFRVMQESLQNIIKHAAAKTINVRLQFDINVITFCIRDDGVGFNADIEQMDAIFKLGLRNMQQRTQLISGVFKLDTKPGMGTCITIVVPRKKT